MRLSAILMLLACLSLVNSLTIDEIEEIGTMKRIRSLLGDIKKTVHELNNAPGTKPICVLKICSHRVERPVIADHFRAAVKATGKWWDSLVESKLRRPSKPRDKAYRITDILLNRQWTLKNNLLDKIDKTIKMIILN